LDKPRIPLDEEERVHPDREERSASRKLNNKSKRLKKKFNLLESAVWDRRHLLA